MKRHEVNGVVKYKGNTKCRHVVSGCPILNAWNDRGYSTTLAALFSMLTSETRAETQANAILSHSATTRFVQKIESLLASYTYYRGCIAGEDVQVANAQTVEGDETAMGQRKYNCGAKTHQN